MVWFGSCRISFPQKNKQNKYLVRLSVVQYLKMEPHRHSIRIVYVTDIGLKLMFSVHTEKVCFTRLNRTEFTVYILGHDYNLGRVDV